MERRKIGSVENIYLENDDSFDAVQSSEMFDSYYKEKEIKKATIELEKLDFVKRAIKQLDFPSLPQKYCKKSRKIRTINLKKRVRKEEEVEPCTFRLEEPFKIIRTPRSPSRRVFSYSSKLILERAKAQVPREIFKSIAKNRPPIHCVALQSPRFLSPLPQGRAPPLSPSSKKLNSPYTQHSRPRCATTGKLFRTFSFPKLSGLLNRVQLHL